MSLKPFIKRIIALAVALVLFAVSSAPAVFGSPEEDVIDEFSDALFIDVIETEGVAGGAALANGAAEATQTDASQAADATQAVDATQAEAAQASDLDLPDVPTPAAAPEPDFSDLSAAYADLTQEEKAEILNRLGLLLGDPEIGLMLDIMVRRSDAAVFFTRLLGQEQYVIDRRETDFATSRFPDAPEGMWYTPYISFCTSIGIIAGRTDGYYYPDDNISEKEFANVLLKILGYVYEVDYNWDTVYEFSYDVGLFDDPSYATRKEDNREYYRRDVCDQVFAVLCLEKKNSPKLLIEELVEIGAVSEKAATDLGFDLSGLDNSGQITVVYPDDADIYNVYHLEPDLLWVVFTKPVTFRDEAVEICQTYDYSKVLTVRVEDKSGRDALLRTGEQIPHMDYTIDISNVIESDGTNAGMLSFDFVGFDPDAAMDAPGGLTSLHRDVSALPGLAAANTAGASGAGQAASNAASAAGAGAGADEASGIGAGGEPADGALSGDVQAPTGEGGFTGGGGGGAANPSRPSGNADPSADYFRVVNVYTTASNELVVYFSHPISETALNTSFYNITQGSTILSSGSAGQIRAELVENTTNAVRLTASGISFIRGSQYRVSVSGRLTSNYTARMNEGVEDSYTFVADNVAEKSNSFLMTSISTISQYGIEIEFSQPLHADTAKQAFNYLVLDHNNRKMDIASASVIPDRSAASAPAASSTTGSGAGSGSGTGAGASGDGRVLRINLTQPLLTQQNCSLTIIYAQNSAMTSSIVNQTYQFQYGGQGEVVQKSPLALTGATSNDPASAELYFSIKLDPVSAVATSNYTINGPFDGRNQSINPVKVSYDPVLSPYMVRLYFAADRRFLRDNAYSIRISNTIRDEKRLSPERVLEMQFYANNRDSVTPVLKDAVIVGEGLVRLDFSKEIMFDPTRITESNFVLTDAGASGTGTGAGTDADAQISPILVKYIDSTTVILRFDVIDMSRRYTVRFNAITDFSGQYTTRYPERGSSVALRSGKR